MGHIGPHVTLDNPAFVHDTALLYGRIHIAPAVSILPYVVMRAEAHEIRIGARSNVQDFVMIHVGDFGPTIVGKDCSITHHATLHGCRIGDRCLVGINATIMDGARIGANSVVAGHALVTENSAFPDNAVIAGVPAKQIGERDSSQRTRLNARLYETIGRNYAVGEDRLSEDQIRDVTAPE